MNSQVQVSERMNDCIKQHPLFWCIWYPWITLTHAALLFGYRERRIL